jgi:hypothetical protein
LVDDDICIILWIDEEHVDEKTLAFFESDTVMIVPCLSKQVKERLAMIQKAAPLSHPPPGHQGYFLQRNTRFQGRLRFIINPRDPKKVTARLQKAGMMSFPMLVLTGNMKEAGLNPAVEIQVMKALKPDILVSLRDVDIRNFCHMSSILWLNPVVDPEIPGVPSQETVSEARRHILGGVARHGTVVFEMTTVAGMVDFLLAMKAWLWRVPSFRILVSHHNFRTLTGKEALPDFSSATITSFLLSLRTKLACPTIPVLIFSTDLASLHDSVYTLPICKPTNSLEESIDLGAMWPLTWVPDWSLFDSLLREESWTGELNIFDISCFNLYPHNSDGTSDPYVVANLNGVRKTRLKSRRQDKTLSPAWASLNWNFQVSSADSVHFIVWDHDTFGKDSCLGEIIIPLREIFKSPMPLLEMTLPLQPKKGQTKISGTITVRLGLSLSSRSGEKEQPGDKNTIEGMKDSESIIEATRSIRIRGKHFGRPLGDSLRVSEEMGMRHVTHACIAYIMEQGMNSVGIFRIVGNRRKVKEAQAEIDLGRDFKLDDPFVAASLLKLYLRELPDPLVSSSIYRPLLALQSMPNYSKLLPEMRRLLGTLSRVNRDLLADTLELMHRAAENESVNLMSYRNLATTIAPTLVIPPAVSKGDINELLLDTNAVIDLVQVMIQYNFYLFPESPDEEALPKEIVEMDECAANLLDRSPPSSPEGSDNEAE